VIALALALSAAAFADHFWARDLGALARDVAESREDPEAAFFGELIRLCNCEPLTRLEGIDPLRALLRVEEARRMRLGARVARSATIWRDVLRPDFFRRDPGNPSERDALEWPDEEERWTGERLLVAAPRSACVAPAASSKADVAPAAREVPPGLVAALAAAGQARTASVVAYHESTLLWRANKMSEAAFVARAIDPGRLDGLSRWARLLRIATGVDPREAAIALAGEWEGEGSTVVRVLAVDALARAGRWGEGITASDGLPDAPRTPLLAHARLLRARALFEAGHAAAARSALPRDDRGEPVRDLAIEVLAADPLDAGGLEIVGTLFPDTTEALLRIARRALSSGSIPVARSAMTRLDPAEPRVRALGAELAFASSAAAEVRPALATVFSGPLPRGMRRASRDRAVVELCRSLVELAPRASPDLRVETAAILLAAREDLGAFAQKAVDSAVAALRTQGAAAIGVIRVGSSLPLPELPPIQVDWPEPRSLLSIPDGQGGLRDWFPEATAVAGGPKT
jgi:hypothetical protein